MDNKKRVKVVRISAEVNRGSIGRTAEQLGELVQEQGWDSYIAYGRKQGISKSRTIRIGNRMSIYWHVFISRFFDMHGLGSYFATKKFIKELDAIAPQIVHLHNLHGYYVNYYILFKYLKNKNIPVVWTHHDCWAFTGHCGFYSSVGCEKWKNKCEKCPLSKEYPASKFFDISSFQFKKKKELFTSLDKLYNVGVSKWMVNQLKESFFKDTHILQINNGIDTDLFRPSPEGAQQVREKYNLGDKTVLIAVAVSWTERKGLGDYLKLRKLISDDYLIVLVGTPRALIETLPPGITGIPRTDNIEELCYLYSASSIVMNLADAESFGKTTPEGLSCGIPSIVYNCTASPELVDDKTGIVVEKGNIEGVVDAIDRIMSWDKDSTKNACRQRAIQNFSTKNNWPQYITLYKSILDEDNR